MAWGGLRSALLSAGVAFAPGIGTAEGAPPKALASEDRAMGDGLRALELELTAEDDPSAATTCADGPTTLGIDVSKWQASVDWNAVANDGVEFAFIRVSHGVNTIDQFFEANWDGARDAGILRGAYQFFEPGQDPITQANILLDKMGPLQPGDLPPVIDVESHGNLSAATVASKVKQWVDHVEGQLGVKPIIYTGRYFWQDYVKTAEFAGYPLWIAHYTTGCPNLPVQWSDWTFHQYTDNGSTDGVDGPVDTNRFNGDKAALLAFAVGGGCGDGSCSSGEDSDNCLADCEPCGVIEPEGGAIDDDDACLTLHGPAEYWRTIAGGEDGTARWTGTISKTNPVNYATVDMFFAEAGSYRVEAFLQPQWASSKQAKYKVEHANGLTQVVVNQSTKNGWSKIGDFAFDEGSARITLGDNTGEGSSLGRRLGVDAFRFTPIAPLPNGEPDVEDDGEIDPDDGDGLPGPTDFGRGDSLQACSVGGADRTLSTLALVVLGALRRRRRAA
jgi:lysozyme